MPELDEKLNAILSDPGSMAQIMQLAQQLSGTLEGSAPPQNAPSAPPPPPPDAAPFSLPGGLDPSAIRRFMPLLQEYNRPNSSTMQLLMSLRPFLKEEKQGKIERAAKLARLIHIGKRLLSEWEAP